MCEQPKIHVFLGAPAPPCSPVSEPLAEVGREKRPPAVWKHLELTWRQGRLRPATNEPGDGVTQLIGNGEEEGGLRSQLQEHQRNCKADWTKGTVGEPMRELVSKGSDLSSEAEDGPGKDQCSTWVHEYLEGCFPAIQPEPDLAVLALSTQTHYLSTWTLSQALILRGRHNLQSPSHPHTQTSPSVSSSTPELFSPEAPSTSHACPTLQAEEGGVVLQATTEGVLCSQESTNTHKSPTTKRPRISEEPVVPAGSRANRLQSPVTPLLGCVTVGRTYSVLVVVVYPCHLKEIKVKSGPSAGTFVPLASIVVMDHSGTEMKVVLWRQAAFWVLTVNAGDVLLITGLQVSEDRWRGETVLQSTFRSKLLNLGHASTLLSGPHDVDAHLLSSLCSFVRKQRPLLVSLPCRPVQKLDRLPYVTLRMLRVNTLVHALLQVTHSYVSSDWRNEAESRSRSAVQIKAVVSVEQPDGQQGVLILWGSAVDWLGCFHRNKNTVWDFHILLVREGLTSDLLELHSTPWSSVKALDLTDRRVQEFQRAQSSWTGSRGPVELDLDTLLSQKYSGEVELRVQIWTFKFQDVLPSQNPVQPVLDSSTPLDAIVAVLSGDITYTGCARCYSELDTDTNGIYVPCYPCLPHTAVCRFYRPGVLMISGRDCSKISVQVPPVPLQKILKAPPDRLQRSSALGPLVKHIQVAAERIHHLLSNPKKTFCITLQSHFLCDENSIPISQDFTLLDFQFPSCVSSL
ncbi:shieldin complex subunit 2 [Nothobranchius furzeri]|uniref:Family with sequence similarity 35 member A n=1 Tax=Nothobranchius furzeri TaxID=105023 RepID=A0A9D2YG47_NOTFU|nr:shieldin complex subunit 2 [Nothobranchius furzeri]XP_054593723.1 shieldin complex subunit 2 [Nothobranchius furzeri]KAF7219523.1 family with sequence similarity 35 member A [Nothobranchius furzeri]